MNTSSFQSGTTICAKATPAGRSAIGAVKLSGPMVADILSHIFIPYNKSLDVAKLPAREALYGDIVDKEQRPIDDVVLLYYVAPKSYTGEEMCEIFCHGNPLILNEVIKLCIVHGAVPAAPGEFTRRAFANGKMDLSQAEAVADLIDSTNRAALRMSATQMRGRFGAKICELRDELVQLASLLELELDFSEEDVEFANRDQLKALCHRIIKAITELHDSYDKGRVIKEGIPIAITGATNAGKSTLLNGLIGEDRAIVSDIHGTTRDTVEEPLYINGQEFRIIDTAGLRHTDDSIEKIGIERSLKTVRNAMLTLWIIDATQIEHSAMLQEMLRELTAHTEQGRIVPIVNKRDLISPERLREINTALKELGFADEIMDISAKKEEDVVAVKNVLAHHFEDLDVGENDIIVSNIRHAMALAEAKEYAERVLDGMAQGLSGEFIAQDLRAVSTSLGSIIGDISSEDILQSIFQRFCIGK